jgi:hypothetical protein
MVHPGGPVLTKHRKKNPTPLVLLSRNAERRKVLVSDYIASTVASPRGFAGKGGVIPTRSGSVSVRNVTAGEILLCSAKWFSMSCMLFFEFQIFFPVLPGT